MPDKPQLIRDERASDSLEVMLVFGVVTVLGIRSFLALTGYPQVGGGQLHIAHMLWGGLGMLITIALLLSFWSPMVRQFGAVLGGVGFGFFIDELGKFITKDNDYFFQPTIALIYVLFILLFLCVRRSRSKTLTGRELEVNQQINQVLAAGSADSRAFHAYVRITDGLRAWYDHLIATRWFAPALSIFFIATAIGQIIAIITLVTGGSSQPASAQQLPLVERAATAVSALFMVWGVIRLRRSRLSAYRWFLRSTLVTILVTQVFMFYYSELAALGGLILHLLLYSALRVLIAREEELAAGSPHQELPIAAT